MSLLSALLAAETLVWQALATGDTESDRALLAPGFLGVYPTGFAIRDDHAGQLANGPSISDWRIEDYRCLDLAPDLGLLCYRARFLRPGATEWEEMFVSSLWQNGPHGWLNLFSQDTPAGPALP